MKPIIYAGLVLESDNEILVKKFPFIAGKMFKVFYIARYVIQCSLLDRGANFELCIQDLQYCTAIATRPKSMPEQEKQELRDIGVVFTDDPKYAFEHSVDLLNR